MTLHLKDFIVGQTAYISGMSGEKEPTECIVKTIGTKYVTVGRYSWDSIKYKEDLPHEYLREVTDRGSASILFRNLEDYNKVTDYHRLMRWLEYKLPHKKMTYEQLKMIKELVDGFEGEESE